MVFTHMITHTIDIYQHGTVLYANSLMQIAEHQISMAGYKQRALQGASSLSALANPPPIMSMMHQVTFATY